MLAGILVAIVGAFAFLRSEDGAPVVQAARDLFAERRVMEHADVLRAASEESGVDVHLLAGLMIAESSGKPGAVSHKGALGLFQLMPATARWRAAKLGLELPKEEAPLAEALLTDPLLNARLGADNLAWLLSLYDGNEERALVAYNAGPGRLKTFEAEAGGWEAWRAERRAAGDSKLFAYVDRVLRYARSFEEHELLRAAPATASVTTD